MKTVFPLPGTPVCTGRVRPVAGWMSPAEARLYREPEPEPEYDPEAPDDTPAARRMPVPTEVWRRVRGE